MRLIIVVSNKCPNKALQLEYFLVCRRLGAFEQDVQHPEDKPAALQPFPSCCTRAHSGTLNAHICKIAMNPSGLSSFFNEEKSLISKVATGPTASDVKRTVHLLILISIFPIIFVEL